MPYKITPELDVENIDRSLKLYVDVLGFKVLYSRPEENFAYLELDGVHMMLEEAAGSGRRFRTAPLEHPYGRGMNLQIEVGDAKALYDRVQKAELILLFLSKNAGIEKTRSKKAIANSLSLIVTVTCCASSQVLVKDRPWNNGGIFLRL